MGCCVYELGISYNGRTYEEGKKIGVTDGIAALWYIVRYNLLCTRKQAFRTVPQLSQLGMTSMADQTHSSD